MPRPRLADTWARLADAGLITRQNASDYRTGHREPHPSEWLRFAVELGLGRKLKPGMGAAEVRALVVAFVSTGLAAG